MDELPDLPFEQILNYLSLEDFLKTRAVSRRWRAKIDSFRAHCLCFSMLPSGLILGKARWLNDAFAQNFIWSSRFVSFFATFRRTILCNLRHLRLCDICQNKINGAAFSRSLNSLRQLEELDIIRFRYRPGYSLGFVIKEVELNLPLLHRLQLLALNGIKKLTLNAPRLREVKLLDCSGMRVDLVDSESVEKLITDGIYMPTKRMKNLKCLYITKAFNSALLSDLTQLKEIHLPARYKRRNYREDLKVFFSRSFVQLANNPSTLPDEMPFKESFSYSHIEPVPTELAIETLKRFTSLRKISVDQPVQDVQHFLDLLKYSEHIISLTFLDDQPQDLFDRLPEHSAIQRLRIQHAPSDCRFLFRLRHLIRFHLNFSIDFESIRIILEELPFLSQFRIECDSLTADFYVEIFVPIGCLDPENNHFRIYYKNYMKDDEQTAATFVDLNSAIQFIQKLFSNEMLFASCNEVSGIS